MSRRLATVTIAAAVACALSRTALVGRHLDSVDAIGFAAALRHYDLRLEEPHFPGYPLYIATARLPYALGLSEPAALALPGALGSVAVLAAAAALAARAAGDRAAAAAAVLVLSHAFLWLEAERPQSDSFGLSLALAAAAMAARGGRRCGAAGGALLGIALGVRPAYLPLAGLLLLVPPGARRAAWLTAGAVVLLWVIALAAVVGPRQLWQIGSAFGAGHLWSWGNTALSSREGFPQRGVRLAALFAGRAIGCGPGWLGVASGAGAAGLLALGARGLRPVAPLAAAVVPYGATLLVLQNVDNPRHLLPLVALFCVALSCAFGEAWRRCRTLAALMLGAVVLAQATGGLRLCLRYRAIAAPEERLARWCATHADPLATRIYCGRSARFLGVIAPDLDVRKAPSIAVLATDRIAPFAHPPVVWVTSELAGVDRAGARPVARFARDPWLHPGSGDLWLHDVSEPDAAGLPALGTPIEGRVRALLAGDK